MLDNIKILLDLDITDTSQDDLLLLLIEYASSTVTLYVKTDELPLELEFIVDELVVRRYNKIASEGHQNENLQASSITFELDDLKVYKGLLDKWIDLNPDLTPSRRVRML